MRSSLAVPSTSTLPGGNLVTSAQRVNSELTTLSTGCASAAPHTLHAVLALQVAAVLMWLVAAGFGIPAPFVASHYLRERTLPSFMKLFPMYGGGIFDRFSPEVFGVLLGLFTALCALEAYAGWLLWNGERLGALIARLALLGAGWSALK